MGNSVIGAVVVALCAGLAIGTQGAIMRLAGQALGALRTGIMVNIAGGVLAALLLAGLWLLAGSVPPSVILRNSPYWGAAGALGVGILTGIAFALPRLGIAAGLGGIILGQMIAAVVIDTAGWGGTRIPLTLSRVSGLALLLVATYLLLPRR